ncbi:hypothetical protein LUCX_175 [Xanthomonas phage vB_XciM_LucasX]|nr:hypothetical protein LUCX_175 [Xanthomonas phage vB_XciM_LucasX]
MSSDLTLTPKAGLLALINQNTSVPVTENDLLNLFPPEVITDALAGEPNTRITARTTLTFSHAGRATFEYHRIDLANLTPYAMSVEISAAATLDQYLAALAERYGLYLSTSDLEPAVPFDISTGQTEYDLTFNAKPGSLMYVGSGQFKAKIV